MSGSTPIQVPIHGRRPIEKNVLGCIAVKQQCKTTWLEWRTNNSKVYTIVVYVYTWYRLGLSLGRITVAPRHHRAAQPLAQHQNDHNQLSQAGRIEKSACWSDVGTAVNRGEEYDGGINGRNFRLKTLDMCWLWFVHALEIVTSQAEPGMLHRVQETENWALRSEPITRHSRAHQEP